MSWNKTLIVGVPGSIRTGFRTEKAAMWVSACLSNIDCFEDCMIFLRTLEGAGYSNSDILLCAALYGARQEGAECIISRMQRNDANGYIFASPVYFGDHSSIIKEKLDTWELEGKVCGVVSVGAKRNGGQETTDLFTLTDCMLAGGIVVGNGPTTSQYGGTAWAGDKGTVWKDEHGVETAIGTGMSVARTAWLLLPVESNHTLNVLVFSMTPLIDLESLVKAIPVGHPQIIYVDPEDLNVKSCLACKECPDPTKIAGYTCRLSDAKTDEWFILYEKLMRADLVIVTPYIASMAEWFRIFERARCLRRDHLKLSYTPYFSAITEDKLFHVRMLPKFLRQDMTILPPVRACTEVIRFRNNLNWALRISENRKKLVDEPVYVPVGYGGQEHTKGGEL